MPNKFGFKRSIVKYFGPLARRPFLVFFVLFFFAVLTALMMYFNFQTVYLPVGDKAVPAVQRHIFDSAKSLEYREVFSILKQRESDFSRKEKNNYPDIFGLSATSTAEMSVPN